MSAYKSRYDIDARNNYDLSLTIMSSTLRRVHQKQNGYCDINTHHTHPGSFLGTKFPGIFRTFFTRHDLLQQHTNHYKPPHNLLQIRLPTADCRLVGLAKKWTRHRDNISDLDMIPRHLRKYLLRQLLAIESPATSNI